METKIIAEIGCNHKGNMEIAKQLIKAAANAGVWACKFQKRNNKLLLGEGYYEPHPVPENSYGKTYGEHRDFLELSIEQHKELKEYCETCGVVYSTSVWDTDSAKEIVTKLNPEFIKIPSAKNDSFEIYKTLKSSDYKGKIHVSLGMLEWVEIEQLIKDLKGFFPSKQMVYYICTSSYPAENDDIYLLDLEKLQQINFSFDFKLGFSGHHKGIQIDMAAIALGAEFIERHFTLDRTWKGTDHAASLEPGALQKLVRDANIVVQTLKTKEGLSRQELIQRLKLKGEVNAEK